MSFEEEIRTAIQRGKSAKDEYEKATRSFESGWYSLRDGLLGSLLREAAGAFNKEGFMTRRENINGSVVLDVSRDRQSQSYEHRLEFKSKVKERLIICSCSSNLHMEPESFTLDHLTESTIQRKIKEFAELVARGGTPRSTP